MARIYINRTEDLQQGLSPPWVTVEPNRCSCRMPHPPALALYCRQQNLKIVWMAQDGKIQQRLPIFWLCTDPLTGSLAG